MENLLDLIGESLPIRNPLQDMITSGWGDEMRQYFGKELTDELIIASLQNIDDFIPSSGVDSIFYPIDYPVITGLTLSGDDIFMNNLQLLFDNGFTGLECFNLVMTYMKAKETLQVYDTDFNSCQEDYCCYYIAGVRAGLNGMNEGKIESSLGGMYDKVLYPHEYACIKAVDAGSSFAQDYMISHNCVPPTFSDSLEYFWQTLSDFEESSCSIEVEPDDLHPFDSEDSSYHIHEAKIAMERAEWHDKRAKDAIAHGDLAVAKDHAARAASYRKQAQNCIAASKKCSE